MYNVKKANEAQTKYCEEKGYPQFTDGECFSCGQNVYAEIGKMKQGPLGRQRYTGETRNGISVETAGSGLTTGCPFCHASFCD